jgi:hypothetical protein
VPEQRAKLLTFGFDVAFLVRRNAGCQWNLSAARLYAAWLPVYSLNSAKDGSRRRDDVKVDVVEDRLQVDFALTPVLNAVCSIRKRSPNPLPNNKAENAKAICNQRGSVLPS